MPDPARLERFLDKILDDLGGALSVALVRIGDKLGLIEARP